MRDTVDGADDDAVFDLGDMTSDEDDEDDDAGGRGDGGGGARGGVDEAQFGGAAGALADELLGEGFDEGMFDDLEDDDAELHDAGGLSSGEEGDREPGAGNSKSAARRAKASLYASAEEFAHLLNEEESAGARKARRHFDSKEEAAGGGGRRTGGGKRRRRGGTSGGKRAKAKKRRRS
jgi:hypothetical protein